MADAYEERAHHVAAAVVVVVVGVVGHKETAVLVTGSVASAAAALYTLPEHYWGPADYEPIDDTHKSVPEVDSSAHC